ncbi:hypothetical protein GCM10010383_36910 [Streptomyces lomondensis]|uniref:Uncharacterized protein n=2 Tax=Streptomyces lomondensis TaxID=68229 RepID=A0ABQ2X7U7_9ACTN|nr:hypothetical protein GCM10010383_36910 [Streptomyces lomondensis]
MGSRWPRRMFAEHAENVGFGRIIRLHRSDIAGRLGSPDMVFMSVLMFDFVALFAAGIALLGLTVDGSPQWRLPVLGLVLLGWLTAAVARWRRTTKPEERSWIAVAQHGLLMWDPYRKDEPGLVAIPWNAVSFDALSPTSTYLVWHDGEHGELSDPYRYYGRWDLIRAVKRGGPVVPWRLISGTAAAVLVTVLIVWLAWWPPA